MFDIVVETLEDFKKLELWLFELTPPFKLRGSIYIRETSKSYFYITSEVNGKLTLITD